MNLKGENIVVYDLETKIPTIACTKGWASLNEMGISVACSYDYREGRFRVFMDDNIHELVARLNEPETIVVAFNNVNFDNALFRACGFNLKPDLELKNYDMKIISQQACGFKGTERVSGFKLDDHLKACGLPMKTANGVIAPYWFQQRQYGKLIDYCLSDVAQEKALFEHMQLNKSVASAFNPLGVVVPDYKTFHYGLQVKTGF